MRTSRLLTLSSLLAVSALAGTETFTADTTWYAPRFCTSALVQCWGGGAAGGGNPNNTEDGGGGGGGGAYVRSIVTGLTPISVGYDVDVGSGGSPVSGATGNNGSDTIFATTIVIADGGYGGGGQSGSAPGTGGSGGVTANCTGTVIFEGGWGATGRNHGSGIGGHGGSSGGIAADGYNDGTAASYVQTYPTASTPAGAGHGGNGGANTASGSAPASGYGGGGGGGGSDATTSGGAGYGGKMMITPTLKRVL